VVHIAPLGNRLVLHAHPGLIVASLRLLAQAALMGLHARFRLWHLVCVQKARLPLPAQHLAMLAQLASMPTFRAVRRALFALLDPHVLSRPTVQLHALLDLLHQRVVSRATVAYPAIPAAQRVRCALCALRDISAPHLSLAHKLVQLVRTGLQLPSVLLARFACLDLVALEVALLLPRARLESSP
jgi:hypothetical protein